MTPAELRGLAAGAERAGASSRGFDQANTLVPDGCSATLLWVSDGPAMARIRLPNGEEQPVVIGEGHHAHNPAHALTAAALRARAYLMENANG